MEQYIEIAPTAKTSLEEVKCRVPQKSILAPLLFLLYVNNLQNASITITFEISGDMFIAIVRVSVCDAISFEIYVSFLINPFSYLTEKVRTKLQISSERKELFRWKKKIVIF